MYLRVTSVSQGDHLMILVESVVFSLVTIESEIRIHSAVVKFRVICLGIAVLFTLGRNKVNSG